MIRGHHSGDPGRDATRVDVRTVDWLPPSLVRGRDDGHEGPFFPRSDAFVEHLPPRPGDELGRVADRRRGW
jgi:hypothetical protein